jgi:hypothetical protein
LHRVNRIFESDMAKKIQLYDLTPEQFARLTPQQIAQIRSLFIGVPSVKLDQPDNIEIKKRVGRPRKNLDKKMLARFARPTMAQMEQLLEPGQSKVDFVNAAVLADIARRLEKK